MSFGAAVSSALSKYATFSGRAGRPEFWWFTLFTLIVSIVSGVADTLLGIAFTNDLEVVNALTGLLLLLPSLSVTARRLHDTGRSGWWMLLPTVPAFVAVGAVLLATVAFGGGFNLGPVEVAVLVIPAALASIAGSIVLLVFLCFDSSPGANKFGPSTKPPMPGWPTPYAGPGPSYGYGYGYGAPPPGSEYPPPVQPYPPGPPYPPPSDQD